VRRGLSAGRVQSVAVRLIVERESEIEAFKSEEYWEILATVKSQKNKNQFDVSLVKINDKTAVVNNEKTAKAILSDLKRSKYVVKDIKKREVQKHSVPPFTTSTMTQRAASSFGWSAKKTMSVAQSLYEEGLITYHRTDSVNISQAAVAKARALIESKYGKAYLPEKPKFYKKTSKLVQEAHEAIRPTDVNQQSIKLNAKFAKDGEKLYGLIWKRFLASQMTSAIYDETTIEVEALAGAKSDHYLLRASGQIVKFDGWKTLYPKNDKTEEDLVILPDVDKGEDLDLVKLDSEQKFTQPPARYNEASLIKTLEKLGIGRPSTYAPTISTIQVRTYIEKKEGKFFPTPVGVAVNDFLTTNFSDIVDYDFTADMEDQLDKVASGDTKWDGVIGKFWKPFDTKLVKVEENAKRVKIAVEKLNQKCPECTEGELVLRHGRFGKFISCSRFPDCKYTAKYVEKIDMKCPKCEKGDVIVKKTSKGRPFYGCSTYPDCDWASWKNPQMVEKKDNL
jgi:DNA topoisomerase-1